MAMGVEGSGNLYDKQSGDVGPPDLHGGISLFTKLTRTKQQYKEFKETKQNQSAKKKAPEPSQETDNERPENPYKNNNQEPEAQGNITIEQDVHMVEIDPAPDTEKGQPNINEENSSSQNLSRQETVTGKKDVQMSESIVIPETEKIQLNPNNNKRVSPISTGLVTGTIESLNKANTIPNNFKASRSNKDWRQNDMSHDQQKLIAGTTREIAQPITNEGFTKLCKKSETKFRNLDHLLVWCSLYQNQETPKPTLWKLNSRMLNNTFISKELEANLKDEKATSDWDYYKVRCQSIYRACKSPTTPETCIQKLNKKIIELNNKMAKNLQLADLNEPVDAEVEALTADIPLVS
ncbi:24081_t:CDS:2 [Gigaspora margarita]|uniref:24081_t:CDS:1 n=1 Tax=Gigaspora margarita TaxID=4874 RepID=A0ABN7VI15_GIGMA|nr:24081_t:CDS:2 [Gigaspora margarita]